jgi:HdeA/HdeB family
MRKPILAIAAMLVTISGASAQVELKTYADANGDIDVQKFSCAQLAGTFQEDADLLAAWYSGWYNGLAKGHTLNVFNVKEAQHRVIVYCKANPGLTVIKAIDAVFTQMRAERGIKLKK